MPNASDCLVTTVKNISGASMNVSMWPPHGKVFAANEEASVFGDIVDALCRGNKPARCIASFAALLIADKLQMKKTPNPILYDATIDKVRMLHVNNNGLFLADPCWMETFFLSPN